MFKKYSRTPFTGCSVEYHDKGQLRSKENWKDGRKDGLWETYDDYGRPRSKKNWKDGKKDGLSESYHDNGQLEEIRRLNPVKSLGALVVPPCGKPHSA